MYYVSYDEITGKIIGFYHSEIHTVIPISNITLTDEEWEICINNQGKYMVDTNALMLIEAPVTTTTTAEELLELIRLKRNRLLAESDWTQLPDAPMTEEEKVAWVVYRQALRDFPETCDPYNPVWPVTSK